MSTNVNMMRQRIRRDMASQEVLRDFFVYATPQIALAGGGVGAAATVNIPIDADANFEWQKSTYWADTALAAQTAATRVIPLVTIQIADSGAGRQLTSVPVPITTIFGTGEIPFILSQPKVFAARSNITITLTNFDAAAAYNIRVSFIGRKLFNL